MPAPRSCTRFPSSGRWLPGPPTPSFGDDVDMAIEWGDLARQTPISDSWGVDRGTPLDRYYIERFLEANRADIYGHVLEVKDAGYTHRYGGSRVRRASVLDVEKTNSQ